MGIIKAKNVVHEFFRRDEEGNVESITTALDHVNLDVKAGQFIAILGHNGSGKSTLAKHINALLTPTEVPLLEYSSCEVPPAWQKQSQCSNGWHHFHPLKLHSFRT